MSVLAGALQGACMYLADVLIDGTDCGITKITRCVWVISNGLYTSWHSAHGCL